MNLLYLDTEFSSFYSSDKKKSGELLQLAVIPVINGVVEKSFNEKCRPLTNVWNSHAEKVHNIPRHEAMTYQHPKAMAAKLKDFLEGFDCMFTPAGWNIRGDKSYLDRLVTDYNLSSQWHRKVKYKWRDVLIRVQKRKKFFPVANLKLGTVSKYFGIELNAHNALSDADVTRQIDDRCSTVQLVEKSIQLANHNLEEVEKQSKYTDRKYLQMADGTVYISEHATKNPEAMKVILQELWDIFVEGD